MNNNGFFDAGTGTPITLIAPGDSVVWTIMAGRHNILSYDASFDSGMLSVGDTFTHTFDAGGLVPYRCGVHASMQGVVVVK